MIKKKKVFINLLALFFLITYKREKKEKKEHHKLEGNKVKTQ